ncbi:MAG: hypothetical protein OXH14_02535, partial [Alphaproteobacteria bacterium]|nr:hypothetical protein [Alphaproteobacteria bacterium]
LGDAHGNCPEWSDATKLSLNGAQVSALQDLKCSWDGLNGRLNLVGFGYEHFVPVELAHPVDATHQDPNIAKIASEREVDWLLNWLRLQGDHNPQPYQGGLVLHGFLLSSQ